MSNPIPRNIPYHLYQFIEKTVESLTSSISSDKSEPHPAPKIINLLWYNPIIGATLHFTPWKTGDNKSDIAGPESKYFKELISLAPLPIPKQADIEYLIEYIVRSPQATNAISTLGPKVSGLLGWSFAGERTFIRNILNDFLTCVQEDDDAREQSVNHLIVLNNNNLLLKIIHVFLGVIPQYKSAKGELLTKNITWISFDAKIKAWGDAKNATDAATAYFILLSVIESLQWREDEDFFVVSNLWDYLFNEYSKTDLIPYLYEQNLYLSRLSLYMTIKKVNKTQANAFEKTIKKHLIYWIPSLCNLIKSVNLETLKSNVHNNDKINDWFVLRWSRGLLAAAAPDRVVYTQKYYLSDGSQKIHSGIRAKISSSRLYLIPDEKDNPSEVAKSLVSPWGIYGEHIDVIDNSKFIFKKYTSPYYYNTDDEFYMTSIVGNAHVGVSCSISEENNTVFVDAVNNRRMCIAEIFKDIYNTSEVFRGGYASDWYKKAFGEFYFYFDKNRHEKGVTSDLVDRKKKEAGFYYNLFFEISYKWQKKIKILDIGIGYGRLEKSIIEYESSTRICDNVEFYGLDLSHEMKIRHEDYLGEYSLKGRYRIGDMSEVLEMFNEKFDVIIFAYTTFGCYSDDEQNAEVLRKINNILLPGGVVIIEQFNPAIKEAEKPYWVVDEIIDGRSICLEKTTRYKSFPGDNNYALYTGEYTYKEFTPFGSNLLRRDYYCLKLYKDFWIKNIFNDPKYLIEEINICEDFDINSKYIGDEKSAHMICIIKKYSEGIERLCTIEDAKKILTKFEEILFLVSKHYPKELAGQEKVYKIKFSSIMTDDANSKSAVVEKIKKMPLDYEVFNELTGELKKEVVLKYLPIIAKYCHEK